MLKNGKYSYNLERIQGNARVFRCVNLKFTGRMHIKNENFILKTVKYDEEIDRIFNGKRLNSEKLNKRAIETKGNPNETVSQITSNLSVNEIF